MTITIIFPFRNREITRVKKSLDSLNSQQSMNFDVVFIDYGSNINVAQKVKKLVESYGFTTYIYSYHLYQPWSRSKAINIALQKITNEFCFIADIDMIFSPKFMDVLNSKVSLDKTIYFKVGFLTEEESEKQKSFKDYKISFTSKEGASGLALFPTKKLKELGGFDEFFHFWGAEDNDVQQRFINSGLKSEFYNKEILMLHQWHKIYRVGIEDRLTQDLRIKDIVKMNHLHYKFNKQSKITVVNHNQWGKQFKLEDYNQLIKPTVKLIKNTNKTSIDYIKKELKLYSGNVVEFIISKEKQNVKSRIKSAIKSKQEYYSLKEVNDILLKEILVHYNNHIFSFKVNDNLNKIVLTIKL